MGGHASHADSTPPLYALALAADAAGLCVVPPSEDGSKKPLTAWKLYQSRRPTAGQLAAWYADGSRSGVGLVCGPVSGDLECLEFEDAATWRLYRDTAEACGLGDVLAGVVDGYAETTPGGGIHLLYRCPALAGNTVLARRPSDGTKTQVLIETRGAGGYVIVAPSNGRVHPSGGAYRLRKGGVGTIATITAGGRADLFALARALDEMPRQAPQDAHEERHGAEGSGTRPGDDFAARTAWPAILEPRGWVRVFERNGVTYWRRPGKDRGLSASTNYAGSDLFYPFTSSTAFEPNRSYSKFGAYAVLEHGGDFEAAARALRSQGFGTAHHAGGPGATPAPALPPVPPFPVEVLPPAIRRYVTEAAAAVGVPPEMVAVPLLVCAAACIGRTRRIRLKGGFDQRPILWAAVVGRPGTAKTPAMNTAMGLLTTLQAEAHANYKERMAAYEGELEAWKRDGAKGAKPVKPILAHFFTTDATKEAVAVIAEHAPGVVVARDELSAWVAGFDAYRKGKGGDRQDWLSLWAGTGLKVDRKGGEPLFVPEPTISVVGGIQPDMLPGMAHEAGQDGFIDRFLWVYPDAAPARWSDDEVKPATEEAALAVFRKLRRAPARTDDGRAAVCPDAKAAFVAWHDANRDRIVDAPATVAGVYAKLTNQAARLAVVLHCLWHPDDPARMVERERMEDALALAEYHRAHALRALRHFGVTAAPAFAGLPARVLRALERLADDPECPRGWVSRTRLHRGLGNGVHAPELDAALAALEAAARAERGSLPTATRPAEAWRAVNPSAERMIDDEGFPEPPAQAPEPAEPAENRHDGSFIRGGGIADDGPVCFDCGGPCPTDGMRWCGGCRAASSNAGIPR